MSHPIWKHWQRLSLSLILLLQLFSLCPASALATSSDYTNGVAAYNKGHYKEALAYFARENKADPQNIQNVLYVGLTFSQLGMYKEAREIFDVIGKALPPDHPIAIKARKNMAVITQAHMTSNGEFEKSQQMIQMTKNQNSYLAYAIPDGKIVHWDINKMPIRVYITDGSKVQGWTPAYKAYVSDAMSLWQNATGNKLRFILTTDPKKADINVHWHRNFSHGVIGVNPFQSLGEMIVSSDVHVAMYYSKNGSPMPPETVRDTMIHEFGHAIGIQGHSPYPEDVMYWAETEEKAHSLTQRDKNTIASLYRMEADVKNADNMSMQQSKEYLALMKKGVEYSKQNNTGDALKAFLQAAALNSKDPLVMAAVAECYMTLGNTPLSIEYLRKSLNLDRNMVEAQYMLGTLLLNEGVKYAQKNDLNTAKTYFQESVNHLQNASNNPKAPPQVKQNLTVAKRNLSLLN